MQPEYYFLYLHRESFDLKKTISIFLITVFTLLQYGRFLQYRLCIWNAAVNGSAELCDCIKAFSINSTDGNAASQSKIVTHIKAEDNFTHCNFIFQLNQPNQLINFFSCFNQNIKSQAISAPWQPPDVCFIS